MPRADKPTLARITRTDSQAEVISATPSVAGSRRASRAPSRAGSPDRQPSETPSVNLLTQVSARLAIDRRASTASLTDPTPAPLNPDVYWHDKEFPVDEDSDSSMDTDRAKTPVPVEASQQSETDGLLGTYPEGSIVLENETYVQVADCDRVFIPFGGVEDLWDSLYTDPSLYKLTADCVAEWTKEKRSHSRNYVLGRYAGVDKAEEWTLTRQALSWFGGGEEPQVWSCHRDGFFSRVWWIDSKIKGNSKKMDTMFPEGHKAQAELRHLNDKSFLWFSLVGDCWPLPLVCGPDDTYDALWSFTFKDKGRDLLGIKVLSLLFKTHFCGTFSVV